MKLLDELIYAVRSYADELGEARHNCTLQEDIDSLGARIAELGKLVKFCERAKTVAEHGPENQTGKRVRPHRGKVSMSVNAHG